MCVEQKWLPRDVMAMSTADYINLVATMSKGTKKPLKWDEGGKGVVLGWAAALKKQREHNVGSRSERKPGTHTRRPTA